MFKLFDKSYLVFLFFLIFFIIALSENNFLSLLFHNLTGKAGFTGRTYLWRSAIEMIKNSPVFGYGVRNEGYLLVWNGHFSSHNTILEIILQGGFLSLIMWFVVLQTALKKIQYFSNGNYIFRILSTTLFCILIALMMEASVHSVYLFSILTLINLNYNIKKEGKL